RGPGRCRRAGLARARWRDERSGTMTSTANDRASTRADGSTGEPRVTLRPGQQGPPKDIIVLDCSMVWAGPYCTKLLGDMGATIIKIEANRQLDSIRGPAIPPPIPLSHYANDAPGPDPWNRSGYF